MGIFELGDHLDLETPEKAFGTARLLNHKYSVLVCVGHSKSVSGSTSLTIYKHTAPLGVLKSVAIGV
jgi:hypothetical protein